MRYAVVGYGLSGSVFHGPLIESAPDSELVAVVTGNAQRQSAAAAAYPDAKIIPSVDELLNGQTDIDVLVVATTNAQHVPLTLRALDHGLHVVLEKPMAGTRAEAEQVFAHAEKVGRQVHVFQNRRWDSDFLTVSRLISSGELGNVHRFQSAFERFRPQTQDRWRDTGSAQDLAGLLYDLGSHLADQALVLFGPADRVYASARALRAPHIADDDTVITIEHTSGVISELAVSALAPHLAPRFRVLGNRAGLVIEGLDEQENALRDGERPIDDSWGKSMRTVQIHRGDAPIESQSLDRGRWDLFYPAVNAAINGVSEPPVSPLSAVATIDLLERAVLSARSGQWVDCT
jgi:predicted dehydrogenase